MLPELEIQKCVDVGIRLKYYVSAVAARPAVRRAYSIDYSFVPAVAAVSAVAALYEYSRLVYEAFTFFIFITRYISAKYALILTGG